MCLRICERRSSVWSSVQTQVKVTIVFWDGWLGDVGQGEKIDNTTPFPFVSVGATMMVAPKILGNPIIVFACINEASKYRAPYR